MRVSWSRVCACALVYFATAVAATATISYWFARDGSGGGQPMVIAGWVASMIVAVLASFVFAVRRPALSFLHLLPLRARSYH